MVSLLGKIHSDCKKNTNNRGLMLLEGTHQEVRMINDGEDANGLLEEYNIVKPVLIKFHSNPYFLW